MKPLWLKIHLYAGLIPAFILVLVALSGAWMALEGDLFPSSFRGSYYELDAGSERSPVEPILQEVQHRYGQNPRSINLRGNPSRPDEYRLDSRVTVFVNPYTGTILGKADDFRTWISRGIWTFHASLLLGTSGRWLVGASAAILTLSLVSGLILGLFRLRKLGWKALSLRWTGNPKSWNLRFHNVLGVLALPVLLLIAYTGCFIAFQPVESMTLKWLGVNPQAQGLPYPASTDQATRQPISVDDVIVKALAEVEGEPWRSIRIHLPDSSRDVYRIQLPDHRQIFLDQHSGRGLTDPHADQRRKAPTMRWFVRGFHYGDFYGLLTQIIWFFACLSVPFFTVSGTIIWWTRNRKSRAVIS